MMYQIQYQLESTFSFKDAMTFLTKNVFFQIGSIIKNSAWFVYKTKVPSIFYQLMLYLIKEIIFNKMLKN